MSDQVTGIVVYVHGTGDRVAEGGVLEHRRDIDAGFRAIGYPCRVDVSDWGDRHGSDPSKILAAVPAARDQRRIAPAASRSTEEEWESLVADPMSALRRPTIRSADTSARAALPPSRSADEVLEALTCPPVARDVASIVKHPAHSEDEIADAVRGAAASVRRADDYRTLQRDASIGELEDRVRTAVAAQAARSLSQMPGARGRLDDIRAAARLGVDIDLALKLWDAAFPAICVAADLLFGGAWDNPQHLQHTGTLMKYRKEIMGHEGLRGITDILRYLRNGDEIRGHVIKSLADAVRDAGAGKVIAIGNSLGGIILAEVLAEAKAKGVDLCDLLVTTGSQPGALMGIGALSEVASGAPFAPWLNIYDERDFMGFLAESVWGAGRGITDKSVDLGVGFPHSHGGGYYRDRQTFDHIQVALGSASKTTDPATLASLGDPHAC